MFEYTSKHDISRVVFDPFQTNVDESVFESGTMEWKELYGDIEEEFPPGMPEELGKSAQTTCFVDFNHDGNVVNRISHKGVLIYVMNAPIIWF